MIIHAYIDAAALNHAWPNTAPSCIYLNETDTKVTFGLGPDRTEAEILAAQETWNFRCAIPKQVTAVQARKALTAAGLRETVEQWVQTQPQGVQDDWYYADPFSRMNPTLLAGAQALGWTDEQLDALFVAAATL